MFVKPRAPGDSSLHSNGLLIPSAQGPAPEFWESFNTSNVNVNPKAVVVDCVPVVNPPAQESNTSHVNVLPMEVDGGSETVLLPPSKYGYTRQKHHECKNQ